MLLLLLLSAATRGALAAATVTTTPKGGVSEYGPCYRQCTPNGAPRVCLFDFVEELYSACGTACGNCTRGVQADCLLPQCVCPDGVERTIMTVNRKVPSPPIHVCKNDIVRVKFTVHTPGHGETIHWHGIRQIKSPFMDGVGMVTQCPINDGQTFVYQFVSEESGTYWYHPHYGLNKANGVAGALVVHNPPSLDPHKGKYTKDLPAHTIVMSDYLHFVAETVYPGLRTTIVGQPNQNVLFDGKGIFRDTTSNSVTATPIMEYVVVPGQKYRFRFIGASILGCPISIQFEGHSMELIAVDGMDVKAVTIDTFVMYAGERMDVVVTANRTQGSMFWIHATTAYGICQNTGAKDQVAVLRYASQVPTGKRLATRLPSTTRPSLTNRLPSRAVFNDPLAGCAGLTNGVGSLCTAQLVALRPPASIPTSPRKAPVVATIAVRFKQLSYNYLYNTTFMNGFLAFGDTDVSATLNNISFSNLPAPLFQPEEAEPAVCSQGDLPLRANCNSSYCECPHVIQLPTREVVDIIFCDSSDLVAGSNATTSLSHPMHLHGYSFRVLSMGTRLDILNGEQRVEAVRASYNAGRLPVLSSSPCQKDTILLMAGGFAVVRIYTDNPGPWFLHCHFDYHMQAGMEMVVQVGETYEFLQPPPNFPRCGNFNPPPPSLNQPRPAPGPRRGASGPRPGASGPRPGAPGPRRGAPGPRPAAPGPWQIERPPLQDAPMWGDDSVGYWFEEY